MVKKRVYVILIIILIVFLIVMFSLFGTKNIKEEKASEILIVGDETVWKYSEKKWHNIKHTQYWMFGNYTDRIYWLLENG